MHINSITSFDMIHTNSISILPPTDTQTLMILFGILAPAIAPKTPSTPSLTFWIPSAANKQTNYIYFQIICEQNHELCFIGAANVSTQKLVQKQDSCLKSHLPPECKRCISAVFHWAAFAGYWQKPTNYPYIKVSCWTFKMNLATCRFLCLSFLSQMSTERTHATLSCIFHCTIFGNVHF